DGHLLHRGAHQRAARADQHDLIVRLDLQRADHFTVALGDLQRYHALPSTAMDREILYRRALAVTVFRCGEHHTLTVERDERDDLLSLRQAQSAHAGRRATHRTHVILLETDGLAAARAEHDLARAVGDVRADQPVARLELDGDDPGLARPRERLERGLLAGALRGGHEHELGFLELVDRQDRIDALAFLQGQQVDDRLAARAAARLRQLIHLQPVQLAGAREAQQRVMSVRHEQLVDEILVLDGGRSLAAAAAALRLVHRDGLRL